VARFIEKKLPEIQSRCKSIANHLYLSNATMKVRESVQCTCLLLLQNAEKFTKLKGKKRDQFLWDKCHAGVNKACRRPVELQPLQPKEDPDDESPEIGTLRYIGRYTGNPAQVENDLIARIDVERATAKNPEPEPTEYEMAVNTLGQEDADWYWDYKYELETTHQRSEERIPKTGAEMKRFHHLKRRLGLV